MPVFTNVVGTPANPQFAEYVRIGTVPWSNTLGRRIVQVFHLRKQFGSTPTDPQELVDTINNVLDTVLKDALPTVYTGQKTYVRFMDDPTTGETEGDPPSNGTVAGDRATLFNAVTVQLKTDGRGRSYRGSKHFAPVSESHTTLDNLNGTGTPLWQDVADAIASLSGFSLAGGQIWTLIVLSTTYSDLTANPSIFTGADLLVGGNGAKLNATIGTMRRRKEKAA